MDYFYELNRTEEEMAENGSAVRLGFADASISLCVRVLEFKGRLVW